MSNKESSNSHTKISPVKTLHSTMSISKLAGDTIADILSRIPVKSVTQFKCVCKSWCSIISSAHFVKLQLNQVVNDVNLRCNRVLLNTFPAQSIDCDDVVDSSISLDFVSGIDILSAGSCNGLVCGVFGYDKIVIFNPTTRDLIELPKPSILSEVYFRYGFGYDSSSDDYKLLRVFNPNNFYVSGRPILAEIFSMRNNCWRRINDIHPDSGIYGVGVFLNGALHGLTTSTTQREIVTFDLGTERFELGSLPMPGVDIQANSVGGLQDCLSVNVICPNFEIWVMKEYGVEDSWTKLCTILYPLYEDWMEPVCCTVLYHDKMPLYEDWMLPVCCTKDGEIVMDVDGRALVMYNAQESTFRMIGMKGDWDTYGNVVYFETLVSPRIGP